MGEAQVGGEFQQRHLMPVVGPYPTFIPAPNGVGVGPDAPGDLRPGKARLLLKCLEPLREVGWQDVDRSTVVSPQSRREFRPLNIYVRFLAYREGLRCGRARVHTQSPVQAVASRATLSILTLLRNLSGDPLPIVRVASATVNHTQTFFGINNGNNWPNSSPNGQLPLDHGVETAGRGTF